MKRRIKNPGTLIDQIRPQIGYKRMHVHEACLESSSKQKILIKRLIHWREKTTIAVSTNLTVEN